MRYTCIAARATLVALYLAKWQSASDAPSVFRTNTENVRLVSDVPVRFVLVIDYAIDLNHPMHLSRGTSALMRMTRDTGGRIFQLGTLRNIHSKAITGKVE